MGDVFEVDTDHKPLVPLLSGYRTTTPLRSERGYASAFNALTIASIESLASKNQAEFELRQTVEEFEKDIITTVKSSVPEAVTWQELLEETHSDTELSKLKEAIARGYFTA